MIEPPARRDAIQGHGYGDGGYDSRVPLPAPEQEPRKPRSGMNFWATVRFAILCAVIFFGLRAVAPTYAIEGESMSPTFHDGGRVILNGAYRFQTPHRGDIVVFDPPYASSNPYIKRVIALPGERLSIHDGRVYINDVPLDERYLEGVETTCQRAPHCDLVIPDDYVYVLGDNRNNSSDSRYFGPIPTGNIVGEVLITIWK